MLIGREHEQQVIDQLVSGARVGSSGVLAITGEPGVGKTSLLDWTESRLDGFQVLRATGTEPEREIPFSGLLTVLRPALGLLDTIAPPQARALRTALAMTEGDPADRFAVGAATLSLLCSYAEAAPVALLVDDLQLMDRPSAAALVFAVRRLSDDPVAVLMMGRVDEVDELIDGLNGIRLIGLDPDATQQLVQHLGRSVSREWLTRVHALTDGNPLAITEFAHDPAAMATTGGDLPPPVSSTLAATFTRRVRDLKGHERSVLLVAAVCNGDLRLTSEVCVALGLPVEALDAAHQAGLADLLPGSGEIRFRHPLLRAALHRDSPPQERRAIHAAVAEALPLTEPDRRAWHLSESLWAPDESVAAMLVDAALRASARSAHAVAASAYERASRLSPAREDAARRLVDSAEQAWAAGLGPRALALLDEMSDPSPELAIRALELRAAIAVRTGSVRSSLALLERAAHDAGSADSRAALLAQAVHAALFLADGLAAGRLADELIATAVIGTMPDRTVAIAKAAAGVAQVLAGRDGMPLLRTALPLLAESSSLEADPDAASWLMLARLFIRDAHAGRDLRSQVDEARANAGIGPLPGLLFLVARDGATSDGWVRAAADYTEAIRLARDTDQKTELAMSLAGLSWLESRRGQETECRTHAEESLRLCADRELHLGQTWSMFSLGDLELSLGNVAEALTHLQSLDRLLTDLRVSDPDLSPRTELVDVLLRLGRPDEAAQLAREFFDSAEAKGQPWAKARARRALGLVADTDFDAAFTEALALHAQTLDRFEAARTALAYGERQRRAGRRVDARANLRRAFDDFSLLGAHVWADRAASELTLTGERVAPRTVGGVAALTPQELQVALLLAEGRTTREAAAALFLSPKTVEYHLRKVYTKLDIGSRDELAAVTSPARPARRRGPHRS